MLLYSKFAGQIDIKHMESVIKDFKTTNMLVICKFTNRKTRVEKSNLSIISDQRVYVTLLRNLELDLQNVPSLFQSY